MARGDTFWCSHNWKMAATVSPRGEGGFVQIGQFQVANSIIKERDHGIQTKLKQSILH